MKKDNSEKIAKAALDLGQRVWIKVFGIKIPFKLKLLRVDTMIRISPYADAIVANDNATSIQVLENAVPASNFLAISLLNKPWKIKLFTNILARSIRNMIPKEWEMLVLNARERCDASGFFLCVREISRMGILLNQKEELKEESSSSEKSEMPKKHSEKAEKKS